MDEFELLIDLHESANRQGPGGDAETEMAIGLAGLSRKAPLKIADIGCGTGASTLILARLLNAKITAVNLHSYKSKYLRRLSKVIYTVESTFLYANSFIFQESRSTKKMEWKCFS